MSAVDTLIESKHELAETLKSVRAAATKLEPHALRHPERRELLRRLREAEAQLTAAITETARAIHQARAEVRA